MKFGFLSDAHGCIEAFEHSLDILRRAGAQRIYFLGDALGYVPGTGVLERLMQGDIVSLLGNHDKAALDEQWDADKESVYQLRNTARALSVQARDFLSGLRSELTVDTAQGQLLLVHGSPDDPVRGYVYPDTDRTAFARDLSSFRGIFMGHTHRPFVQHEGDTVWVNVGSCALPRDGGMHGAVALYDDAAHQTRLLRFPAGEHLEQAYARVDCIHEDVLGLMSRPASGPLVGEVIAAPNQERNRGAQA